ncbi:MAG TPA: methyltransferase [Methylomirabilota bacterium]|nr:methyltransferase [Methylomirabilota bacterium]
MSQPGAAEGPVLGAGGEKEARETAALLARLLPLELRPLFDVAFVRSHVLYEQFVYRLVLQVVRETGLEDAMQEEGRAEDIARRAKLGAQALVPLDWMLRTLAARGLLEALADEGQGRYRALGPLPMLDPASVREEQLRSAPTWMPSYVLAETVARDYPAFLRGETSGEDVLFSPRRLRLWIDYFSNDNGLYVVNNRVGAIAAEQWMPAAGGTILELGGGLGSGALALLEHLEAEGRLGTIAGYRFTEFVPAFLRRGEQTLRARYPALSALSAATLDMNRPFAEQGVAPASVSVVYAVNTLHVARDLDFTLGEIFQALEPGGRLVVSECVRPRPRQPIEAEFVFNLTETFRSPRLHPLYRPSGGFLTPEQWRGAMEAAGFVDTRFLPDIPRLRDKAPRFVVAAVGATRPG